MLFRLAVIFTFYLSFLKHKIRFDYKILKKNNGQLDYRLTKMIIEYLHEW